MEMSRRKKSSPDMKGIPEDVYEFIVQSSIYDKLENLAMTKKLTEVHVKDIINKVIYGINPDNSYGPSTSGCNETPNIEPKLTRAKKKELYQKQQTIKFTNFSDMTHASVPHLEMEKGMDITLSGTKALVNTEFPEDDDDDEYNPELDEQLMSDEESILSLLGSPTTTPGQSLQQKRVSAIDYGSLTPGSVVSPLNPHKKAKLIMTENDGVVKRSLNFSEEQSSLICNRTRSKYPMTDTPLEYLEMSFIPPDITADMYETEIDDDEWKQFILDFVQPVVATKEHHEDDEQGDPEYDLWADADEVTPTLDEIKEELRGDRGVRISKREVNELMLESLELSFETDPLFNINMITAAANTTNNNNNENDIWNLVEQELDDSAQIGKGVAGSEEENNAEPIVVTYLLHEFSKLQLEILQSQLNVHVQLLTQSILMTCYDARIRYVEDGCKKMLNELSVASRFNVQNRASYFETFNLASALDTVAKYDMKREEFLKEQKSKEDTRVSHRCYRIFLRPFPKMFDELFMESCAFPYIQYLPYGIFWVCYHGTRKRFLESEYNLMASGFSEILSNTKVFRFSEGMKGRVYCPELNRVCASLIRTFGISANVKRFSTHLKNLLVGNYLHKEHEDNPFVQYVKTGIALLPLAKVETLPKCRPSPLTDATQCPLTDITSFALKNMTPKFLPKFFFKMSYRYRKEMKTKEKPLAVKPTPKNKIIIVQEGQITKIVLPPDNAVVIENGRPEAYDAALTSTEDGRYGAPMEIVPPQSGFPPFAMSKTKPINTVVPTPVTNVVTFTQCSTVNFGGTKAIYRPSNICNFNVEGNGLSCNSLNTSPQKYVNHLTFTPLKTPYGDYNSSCLDLTQNPTSSTYINNSSLRFPQGEVVNPISSVYTSGENVNYVDSISGQPSLLSAPGSPGHYDMPFLIPTPNKNERVPVIIRPHIDINGPVSQANGNSCLQTTSVDSVDQDCSTPVAEDLSLPNTSSSRRLHNSLDHNHNSNEEFEIGDGRCVKRKRNTKKGIAKRYSNREKRKARDNEGSKNKIEERYEEMPSKRRRSLRRKDNAREKEDNGRQRGDAGNKQMEEESCNTEDNEASFEMRFFSRAKSVLGSNFKDFISIFNSFAQETKSPRYIYPKIRKIFRRHPDLQNEFLIFFNSEQAKKVGKVTEHRIAMCSKNLYDNRLTPELIDKAEVLDTIKAALSLPNKKLPELLSIVKPILSLPLNLLENLS